VAYVAHGARAFEFLFGISLQSLALKGKWDGPVVVVTDNPECLALQRPYAKHLNLHVVRVPKRKNVMDMKIDKTRLWKHIDSAGLHHTQTIIYIDTDVVTTASISPLVEFISRPALMSEPLWMYQDKYYPKEFQTGFIISNRGPLADKCFKDWASKFKSHARDQSALLASKCNERGYLGELMPTEKDDMYLVPTLEGLQKGQRAILMHFTDTGLMIGHHGGQPLLDEIQKLFQKEFGIGDPWFKQTCLINGEELLINGGQSLSVEGSH